jgi:alkyl hydroperoxide reductase subunit AhpC
MKNTIIQLSILVLILLSCESHPDKKSQQFTLNGDIASQDTGIIILQYFSDTILVTDTAQLRKGRFWFTGKVPEPTYASLYGRNYSELARIYIEAHKMNISIIRDKPMGSKMTGSKTQAEFDVLNKLEEPIYARLSELKSLVSSVNDSIKNAPDGPHKLLLEKKAEEISDKWYKTQDELSPIRLKFVLENPKSFVTLDYLSMLESREVISLDSLKSIFNGLDSTLRKSHRARYIIDDIRKKENIMIGNQAPDFKSTALNNQIVTLSQFRGKSIVILDFWASWCVPCRKSIPHLKTVYKKYHSKGLDVIAVSVDENRKAWIDAVKQESTELWYNIPIAENWPKGPWTNNDIFQNYNYTAIPEQFIIDRNGKIIYRVTGYSRENEESLDSLLSVAFKN